VGSSSASRNRESEAGAERLWPWLAAVSALAAILFFVRLGSRALWSAEYRWAEVVREMSLSSNYFWPTINGRLYYDKPLGSYWLIAGASFLTGKLNEVAARLPSAAAGLAAVILLILIARRLYDVPTAVLSGFILATSFSFVFFSRNASADLETIAGVLLALYLFICNERKQTGWWVIWFWLVMATTSLMKGLLGFVLPLLVVGVYCLTPEGAESSTGGLLKGPVAARINWLVERNRWFFNLKSPVAIVLAACVYLGPFIVSGRLMGSNAGLAMVFRENIVRFFNPFDHRGPIYLYAYVIFVLMAPWSLFLPSALVQAYHEQRQTGEARENRFALVWFWTTFLFFTLSRSRRSYYILPILPAGAVLVAHLLRREFPSSSRIARYLLKAAVVGLVIAVVAGAAILMPPRWILPGKLGLLPTAPARGLFALFWLVSIGAVVYCLRHFCSTTITSAVAAFAYLSMAYFFLVMLPSADAYRSEKSFAAQIREKLDGNISRLALYRTEESLFYLDWPKPLPEFFDRVDLKKALDERRIQWVLVRQKDMNNLELPAEVIGGEVAYQWEGARDLRNKVLLLKLKSSDEELDRPVVR
jgi:4-amino-4-deoxy-L-arabinose transferase-like glycosyltransferase